MSEPCLKLTSYFAERQRAVGKGNQEGRFLADAMLDLFGTSNVATSVMLRGIASFGPSHELRSDVSLSLSEDPIPGQRRRRNDGQRTLNPGAGAVGHPATGQ